jgi:WD repeat and SOF domain-containing protein 1
LAKFTPHAHYVLSGSDDGNTGPWRGQAERREGVGSASERQKLEYDAAIVERFDHMPAHPSGL